MNSPVEVMESICAKVDELKDVCDELLLNLDSAKVEDDEEASNEIAEMIAANLIKLLHTWDEAESQVQLLKDDLAS